MTEPQSDSKEWYAWVLSPEYAADIRAQKEVEARKIAERDASPITFGSLSKALRSAIEDLEMSLRTDDRIILAANGAAIQALEKIMDSLGMNRWE